MKIPSKLIEDTVTEFSRLPGIGKKTALRLALYLLKQDTEVAENFGNTIIKMRQDVCFCESCHNISDNEQCEICLSPSRNHELVCVVQGIRDVIAIENTHQYNGVYHVLGGVISPIDGTPAFEAGIQAKDKIVKTKINQNACDAQYVGSS